jgi:hypothetical protein
MAITRSKRTSKPKARVRAARPAPRRAAARGDEPDRSSPQLAEVDAEVLEFIAELDRFKQEHGRPFPSWSEVLLVLRRMGYRRA